MVAAIGLQWIHPPLQERSQQTMERLLSAAEALIAECGFAGATVAAIAKRGESSVGAFYARFKDKDALLRCLLERFVQDAFATASHSLRTELWQGRSVETVCASLVHFMMRMLRERRELIRAITHMAIEEPTLSEYRNVISNHCAEGLLQLVRERGEEFGCSDPIRALRVVSWMCLSMTEVSTMDAGQGPAGLPQNEFEAELSSMILSHLQIRARQIRPRQGASA